MKNYVGGHKAIHRWPQRGRQGWMANSSVSYFVKATLPCFLCTRGMQNEIKMQLEKEAGQKVTIIFVNMFSYMRRYLTGSF